MQKYDYIVVKCHPNLLEEKLQEQGKLGWKYIGLSVEVTQVNESVFTGKMPQMIPNYALIFEKLITE
jgi:hypothetical protein